MVSSDNVFFSVSNLTCFDGKSESHYFASLWGPVLIFLRTPSIQLKVGHHRPASETPSKRYFAGGPMMTQSCMLAG